MKTSNNVPVRNKKCTLYRNLKSNSHKRFCNRDFAFSPYIFDHGESKKGCLDSCRNRNFGLKMNKM